MPSFRMFSTASDCDIAQRNGGGQEYACFSIQSMPPRGTEENLVLDVEIYHLEFGDRVVLGSVPFSGVREWWISHYASTPSPLPN